MKPGAGEKAADVDRDHLRLQDARPVTLPTSSVKLDPFLVLQIEWLLPCLEYVNVRCQKACRAQGGPLTPGIDQSVDLRRVSPRCNLT
jgi:hypothetical protein